MTAKRSTNTGHRQGGSITRGLRQDVIRWREELARLKAEGQYDIVVRVEEWLKEAENVLAREDASPEL